MYFFLLLNFQLTFHFLNDLFVHLKEIFFFSYILKDSFVALARFNYLWFYLFGFNKEALTFFPWDFSLHRTFFLWNINFINLVFDFDDSSFRNVKNWFFFVNFLLEHFDCIFKDESLLNYFFLFLLNSFKQLFLFFKGERIFLWVADWKSGWLCFNRR